MLSFFKSRVKSLLVMYSIFKEVMIDASRYYRWSATRHSLLGLNENQLLAKITAHYHVLEKGLSMPEFRLGFGQTMVVGLKTLIVRYNEVSGDTDSTQYRAAIAVLKEYYCVHQKADFNIDAYFSQSFYEKYCQSGAGRAKHFSGNYFGNNCEFKGFFQSRCSVRELLPDALDKSLFEEAVEVASKTPSVCNRQSFGVIAVNDYDKCQQILEHHNGNRGFGQLIGNLLIVTCDLEGFAGTTERYQSYIDGGAFAMSLMLALHSMEVGCCPLNWSVNNATDRALKKRFGIPDSKNVIMLLAAGRVPEEFSVPFSKRKDASELLEFLS